MSQLVDEDWIVQGEGYALRRTLLRLTGGSNLNILYESNSAGGALHLVASSMGIAFLGLLSVLAGDVNDRKRVALVPVPDAGDIVLTMISREGYNPPPAAREFRSLVVQESLKLRQRLQVATQELGWPVPDQPSQLVPA